VNGCFCFEVHKIASIHHKRARPTHGSRGVNGALKEGTYQTKKGVRWLTSNG